MEIGHFYYLKNKYFVDFKDPYLMKNKEKINGDFHDRPCFYTFKDKDTNIYWMIPFSSRVEKYKKIYKHKIEKHGICDTIVFGNVLGHEKAFLIQNMCPATEEYIQKEYYDSNAGIPVRINGALEKRLKKKAQKVLTMQRRGKKLIFPDVLKIEKELMKD